MTNDEQMNKLPNGRKEDPLKYEHLVINKFIRHSDFDHSPFQ
jgi:hypothetical protein